MAVKRWNGTQWVNQAGSTSAYSYQPSAPSNPDIGDMWVDSDDIGATLNQNDYATNASPTFTGTVNVLGTLNLNNNGITGVNVLEIGDPGPGEGISWLGGNLWKIYESPDDLVTNSLGNLQFVQGSTRRMTINATTGDVSILNALNVTGKATVAGINVSAPSILNLGGHISYTGSTVFNFSDGTTYLTLSPSASGPSIGASTNAPVSLFSSSLGLNIGASATGNGTWTLASGATTSGNTKTINIGNAGLAGSTTNINIGSAISASTTLTTFYGDVVVNGTTTTLNANNLSIDDKNIDLGAVSALSNISGTITGTTTTTTMTGTDTDGMIPGMTLTKVSGTGAFGGATTITSIDSATQFTFTSATVNTTGAIVFNVGGATDVTAAGGGITLKGTTDKTFNWTSAAAGWTSSENISLAAGKSLLLNGGTSGTITITPTATAGTNTITVPATTGTLALTSQSFFIGTQSIGITAGTGTITSLPGVTSVNGATLPSSGTIPNTGQTFYIGTQAITISQGTGTITSLPGVTSVNGTTIPSAATLLTSASTASALTSFGSSPTITTPTIDTINGSSATAAISLYPTSTSATVTLGTLIGSTAAVGTINIANNAGIAGGTKAINIGTGATAGTTTITIGSTTGTTTTLNGTINTTSGSFKVGNTSLVQGGTVNITFPTLAGTLIGTGDAGSIATTMLASSTNTTTGVTYAKMQFASAQYRVLGRITAASGNIEELTPDNLITTLNQATTALQVGKGGTGVTTAPTAGGIAWGATTSTIGYTAAGTSGQILVSNAASAPSWITSVPIANGGTGATTANAAMANLMGYTSTVTSATTYVLSNTSTYYQQFTGSTAQIITLPSTLTGLSTGWTFHLVNNSTANLTVNATVATALVITVPPGTTTMVTCISTAVSDNTAWESGLTDFSTYTGTGNVVLGTSPTITTPTIDTINTSLTTTGTAALWNTGITTASISIGGSLTTGGVSIAGGTTYAGTISLGPSSGTTNKTVSILNGSTAGTQTINVGSNISTSTTNMYGATVFRGISTSEGGQIDLAPANGGNTWYIDSFSSGASATPSLRIINGSTTTFQINSANTISILQNEAYLSQTSIAAAATITPVIILTKNVYYTGAAAALTLDTGTNMDLNASFSAMAVGSTVEWVVINEGTGSATLTSGTGHTFRGTAAVAIQTAAKLVTRKSAANTYFTYRMA